MSRNNRKQSERILSACYSRIEGFPLDRCWYCGDTRYCLDHVPPLAIAADLDIGEFKRRGGTFVLVPSCDLCNTLGGAKKHLTPAERLCFLSERYDRLIEKGFYGWAEEDIAELGRGLQDYMIAKQARIREWIRKKRGVEDRLLSLDN